MRFQLRADLKSYSPRDLEAAREKVAFMKRKAELMGIELQKQEKRKPSGGSSESEKK
jgi:hypothetical protein